MGEARAARGRPRGSGRARAGDRRCGRRTRVPPRPSPRGRAGRRARRGSPRRRGPGRSGGHDDAAADFTHEPGGLAVLVRRDDHGATGREDPVEAARNDVAREPGRQADVVDVGSGERLAEAFARLVFEEAHPIRPELLRQLLQLAAAGAEADDRDRQLVEVAKVRRRDDQLVEVLGVPDVPRVHDHEAAVEPGIARPLVLLGLRRDRRGVDPVRNHDHALRRRALGDQPLAHPLPDRHDRVRSAQVEADERPERRR